MLENHFQFFYKILLLNLFCLHIGFVFALLIGSYPSVVFSTGTKEATDQLKPMVVTAKGGFPEPLNSTAWSITTLETDAIKGNARSLPEALSGIPSIMVQKTALGQSSPYIRGLTGYHNVLLVDGIRLNHSAMRSGPNQYWSTVELFGSDRVEALRGTHGVLFGADAVGGIVNSLSSEPSYSNQKNDRSFELLGRASSAERSFSAGITAEVFSPKWFAEISHMERSFGDLDGGKNVGRQKNTGYDVRGSQARLSRKLSDNADLIFGIQKNFMDDVPRTHKTIDGLTWEGLTRGKEMWRRLDQERDLYYGRLAWEDIEGLANSGKVTLSFHTHDQARNRMKGNSGIATGGDLQTFSLEDIGLTARFVKEDFLEGSLAYGAEWHQEKLVSGGYKFDATGNRTTNLVQGPLAADALYDRFATYFQYKHEFDSGWSIEPGIRYSATKADLRKFYEKNSDTSTLFAPEEKTYEEIIGSLRATRQINDELFVFSGLSQGFRPPSLYDLTSTDETSAVERPNTKLDPEKFLQAELGIRGESGSWEWQTSYYYTWIKDMIVRSPIESGQSDVLKSNGDGFIQGMEFELGYQWTPSWKSELSFSWMDGEVEQMLDNNATGTVAINGRNYSAVNRATTRLMPVQAKFTTHYKPVGSNWSSALSFLAVSKADDLSLKDETDVTRIPSNGTPGYFLANIYGNYEISDSSSISLALENIGDVDYRVHGSGLNGAGRNFILSCSIVF